MYLNNFKVQTFTIVGDKENQWIFDYFWKTTLPSIDLKMFTDTLNWSLQLLIHMLFLMI